jgi:hypothetical protein
MLTALLPLECRAFGAAAHSCQLKARALRRQSQIALTTLLRSVPQPSASGRPGIRNTGGSAANCLRVAVNLQGLFPSRHAAHRRRVLANHSLNRTHHGMRPKPNTPLRFAHFGVFGLGRMPWRSG